MFFHNKIHLKKKRCPKDNSIVISFKTCALDHGGCDDFNNQQQSITKLFITVASLSTTYWKLRGIL